MKNTIKSAVIVCGGRGSRMGNDYSHTQKCLLPIAGKMMLSYIIESLALNQVNNIILITNHYANDVEDFAKTVSTPNICLSTKRSNADGTAGALKELRGEIDGPFVYSHGNIIFPDKWLTDLIQMFLKNETTALFAVSPFSLISSHPHIIGSNNRVEKVIYPNGNRIPQKALCALELSIFSSEIFRIIENIDDSSRLCEVFTDQKIVEKYDLMYYQAEGMWIHIETPNDLKKASSQIDIVRNKNNNR